MILNSYLPSPQTTPTLNNVCLYLIRYGPINNK